MNLSPAENIIIVLNITYFVVLFEVKLKQEQHVFLLCLNQKNRYRRGQIRLLPCFTI